ncbi:guanine nucleotide-binding protein subunit beta protein [Trifolium repens]|nr:guanine nucleotide-binding protein subunit beta protein [Trifolium repens]
MEPPLVDSLVTPKMFSPELSRSTTVRSCLLLVTARLRCGEQDGDAHSDWVCCVRFSSSTLRPTIVSASWDRTVKVWNRFDFTLLMLLLLFMLCVSVLISTGYVLELSPASRSGIWRA